MICVVLGWAGCWGLGGNSSSAKFLLMGFSCFSLKLLALALMLSVTGFTAGLTHPTSSCMRMWLPRVQHKELEGTEQAALPVSWCSQLVLTSSFQR